MSLPQRTEYVSSLVARTLVHTIDVLVYTQTPLHLYTSFPLPPLVTPLTGVVRVPTTFYLVGDVVAF